MKRTISIFLLSLLLLFMTACGGSVGSSYCVTQNAPLIESPRVNLNVLDSEYKYYTFYDVDTGVIYLVLDCNQYSTVITPLYNADGTLRTVSFP